MWIFYYNFHPRPHRLPAKPRMRGAQWGLTLAASLFDYHSHRGLIV
ncbi:MAG: hypothetical protein AAB489_03995 [Patescibacteria group bacterium]